MSALKVTLADAPTDVLVHLVDVGTANVTELAAALAPDDTIDPRATVSYALDLLRRIGYVRAVGGAAWHQWQATEAGRAAVAAAREALNDSPPDYAYNGGECCASGSCEVCDPVRHRDSEVSR